MNRFLSSPTKAGWVFVGRKLTHVNVSGVFLQVNIFENDLRIFIEGEVCSTTILMGFACWIRGLICSLANSWVFWSRKTRSSPLKFGGIFFNVHSRKVNQPLARGN